MSEMGFRKGLLHLRERCGGSTRPSIHAIELSREESLHPRIPLIHKPPGSNRIPPQIPQKFFKASYPSSNPSIGFPSSQLLLQSTYQPTSKLPRPTNPNYRLLTEGRIERRSLTTPLSLDLVLLQPYPAIVCQLICKRRHEEDFRYGSCEGLVESTLLIHQHLSTPRREFSGDNRGGGRSSHEEREVSLLGSVLV
jgi:hypothetical protein